MYFNSLKKTIVSGFTKHKHKKQSYLFRFIRQPFAIYAFLEIRFSIYLPIIMKFIAKIFVYVDADLTSFIAWVLDYFWD